MIRRRLCVWWTLVLSVSVLSDLALRHPDHGAWWHRLPGSFAALGLGSCLFIVWLAKWLGKHWLQRSEDYYER